MKAYDADCSPQAKETAEALGWKTSTPERIVLQTGNDLRKIREGASVVSQNGEWLRQAAKKNVLIDPTLVQKFEKDEGLVRAVAATESSFELPIRPLLHTFGRRRAQILEAYRKFVLLCTKRCARFVVTSQAQNAWDVKSPREISAVIQQFGIPKDKAQKMLAGRSVLAEKGTDGAQAEEDGQE